MNCGPLYEDFHGKRASCGSVLIMRFKPDKSGNEILSEPRCTGQSDVLNNSAISIPSSLAIYQGTMTKILNMQTKQTNVDPYPGFFQLGKAVNSLAVPAVEHRIQVTLDTACSLTTSNRNK